MLSQTECYSESDPFQSCFFLQFEAYFHILYIPSLQKPYTSMVGVTTYEHWNCLVQILMPITVRYFHQALLLVSIFWLHYYLFQERNMNSLLYSRWLGHQMNSLMFLMNFGTACCWARDKLRRVWFHPFVLVKHCDDLFLTPISHLQQLKWLKSRLRIEKESLSCGACWYVSAIWPFLLWYKFCAGGLNIIIYGYEWMYISALLVQERGYSMTGKQEARVAGEKAMALETSYFK